MSFEDFNEDQKNQLDTELMNKVPMKGAIGNITLLTRLRWDDQKY